jgi:hypothetical protein
VPSRRNSTSSDPPESGTLIPGTQIVAAVGQSNAFEDISTSLRHFSLCRFSSPLGDLSEEVVDVLARNLFSVSIGNPVEVPFCVDAVHLGHFPDLFRVFAFDKGTEFAPQGSSFRVGRLAHGADSVSYPSGRCLSARRGLSKAWRMSGGFDFNKLEVLDFSAFRFPPSDPIDSVVAGFDLDASIISQI